MSVAALAPVGERLQQTMHSGMVCLLCNYATATMLHGSSAWQLLFCSLICLHTCDLLHLLVCLGWSWAGNNSSSSLGPADHPHAALGSLCICLNSPCSHLSDAACWDCRCSSVLPAFVLLCMGRQTKGLLHGRYGSVWRESEAEKNLLRTHTTAVSSKMLYRLAQVQLGPCVCTAPSSLLDHDKPQSTTCSQLEPYLLQRTSSDVACTSCRVASVADLPACWPLAAVCVKPDASCLSFRAASEHDMQEQHAFHAGPSVEL